MAPEASDGEQGNERDVTAHQGYYSEGEAAAAAAAADRAEALELLPVRAMILQPLRMRISELLGHAGSHRVVITGDAGRRCLEFIESELSFIAALSTTLTNQQRSSLLHVRDSADGVLREVDPSHHKLLRSASQCFRPRNSYLLLFDNMVCLYYINEQSSRYRNLLTSSDLGLTPPQLDEPEPERERELGALPLLGINRPTKKIFRWLALEHQWKMDRRQRRLRVMSIVGPVGIGKTTLAVDLRNRLRQHEASGGHKYFQCNVMAQASRGVDRNVRPLQDILSQVSEPAATARSFDQEDLVRLVSTNLQYKRYFLIVDNIWEASDWKKIKGAFPDNNMGSRILVTTRTTSTAWACCSNYYDGFVLVHEMKPLSEMDSERLLLAKAIGSVDGFLPNNMNLLCDEILRRCDGIALFIIGLADWLKEQQLQQQHPRLPERLEQAVSYAFNDFRNDDLRLLLFYMSMFPYGYKFEKDRLIFKWIHEGLIDRAKSEPEKLFSQLVDRNVINSVASNCKHNQDEAKACQWQVNHFIHQFLASKSAEIGFIFTSTTLNLLAPAADRGNQTTRWMPRRLALHHPDPQLRALLGTMDLSQTRSLAVSGLVSGIPLDKFANLVVLDLEGWENIMNEDLLQVCRSKMFFLSYLSIRNTLVDKLPHEIKELRTLGTLDISYTQISELPPEIKELRSLETLDISYTQISELPLELFQITHLQYLYLRGTRISQLPKQIGGLKGNFSHLLIGGERTGSSVETAMPDDVRHLSRLQTLATVDLTQHPSSFIRALGDLESLEVLGVTWSFHQSTDKDYCEALLSSIVKWERLESLTIHCGLSCSMEFLGSLEKSRALWRLKKFKVTAGRFTSVPPWIEKLQHLAFLHITLCNKQATDDLKILGDLPSLQCLILGLDFIPAHAIVIGYEGFDKLQRFSVDCPMPWLTFSSGALWKLTYLQLKFCSTPARQICVPSGISNLGRLTEVALCYNAQYINSPTIKMTVQAVTKQVAEHSNPIDLFINGVEQDDVQEADDEVTEITIGTSSRTNAGAEDDAEAVGEEVTAAVQCEITEADC